MRSALLAAALVCGVAALRAGLGAADARSTEGPPTCDRRVQTFDGVSALLTCGSPQGADGERFTPAGSERMAGPALRLLGLKVDVNRASVEDLQSLPGIGPKMAERIAAARPFHVVSDLRGVSGIGPKRFAELEGSVTVNSEGRRFCADHL